MKENNFIIRNKIFLIVLFFIIIFFVFLGFKNQRLNEYKINNDKDLSSWKGFILEDSYTKIQENPIDIYTTFDIEYPSFKQVDSTFNQKIKDLVKRKIDEHREISRENWQILFTNQNDNVVENVPNEEDKFYFFTDFVLTQSNPDYVSFILKFSGFSGGAHGYENYVSFNYDVLNKKELEIKDLFSRDFDYLNYLSLRSREILKNRFAIVNEEDKTNYDPEIVEEYLDSIVSSIEDGTDPEKENFSVFTFLPNKIKIYFAQYQVGPYVIGMPEIEIERK